VAIIAPLLNEAAQVIPPERPSGLPLVGGVPWGTHLCHFYRSKADLVDAVVPFFRAGLSSHERCVLVAGAPEIWAALRAGVPELDSYVENGQIELLAPPAWYLQSGGRGTDDLIRDWLGREDEALSRGFAGLRIGADTFGLERPDWKDFAEYEAKVHRSFHRRRIIALCGYQLGTCGANEIVDVLRNHASALIRRRGWWEVVDSATSMLAMSPPAAFGSSSPDGAPAAVVHDVQFYDDREFLASRVAEFVGEGLTGNEAALLISTRPNTAAILRGLARQDIDPHRYQDGGQLVTVDAHELLPSLLVGGLPDETRFTEVVGGLVSRLRAQRARVRVYGELVNLLIGMGNERATLELERLWNKLLAEQHFRLLCGYEMEAWALRGSPGGFQRVCAAHDRVSPAEGAEATVTDRPRLLADLQHKARVLTFETRTRRALEGERRRLHEAEQRARAQAEEATRHLALLQRVTSALSPALTPEDVARVVVTEMAGAAGADQTVLALPAEDGAKLNLLGLGGVPAATPHPPVSIDAPVPIVAAFHGRVVWLSSPGEIEDAFPDAPQPRTAAIACLPLALGDQRLGAIGFGYLETQEFSPTRRALFTDLARQAGLALDRARLFQKAEHERQRAEQANRGKDEFLATVSHELRTPLTSILGWARMLRAGDIDERGRQRALATIERNARLQAQLLEDLLDVSRISAGKLRLEMRRVDLGTVIQAAADVVRPAADAKGILLETDADLSAYTILADPDRLQQVFWNLLSNAVKFTPKGGRVAVDKRTTESGVEIRVRDTGQGITSAFLPFVFDRFRQAESPTTRTHKGIGLGLAIVRYLVELHGGHVSVESAGEGHGATFIVVLPTSGPDAGSGETTLAEVPAGHRVPPERATSLAGLRVLLVEDEADTREMLAALLEGAGAAVTGVVSVADALRALEQSADTPSPYGVLVADIGLPGEDGYSLLDRVRRLPPERGGRIPAVAVTAYATARDRRRAVIAGFQAHLGKPVEPAELVALLANIVAARASPPPPASLAGGEGRALLGEPAEPRRRRPDLLAGPAAQLQHPVADRLEAGLVGPEHGAAAVDGPAVAVDPDDVDVAGPDGQALLEDLGRLVHHRVEQPLEDLLVGESPARDAGRLRDLGDDPLDLGVGMGRAIPTLVTVEAGSGLLAEAPHLAEPVGHRSPGAAGLADAPAHVEAGQVAHRERPHGEAEVHQHLVDLLRQRALQQQPLGLHAPLMEHAVAHEAVADPDQHRHFADAAAHGHGGGDGRLGGPGAPHDLEQPHDVGGAEEVHADDALRPPGDRGDLVDVEGRGVGGEDGVGPGHPVQTREHLLLEGHLLEDGFDHEVGIGHRADVGGALDEPHALLDVLSGEPPLAGRGLVILAHHAQTPLQRVPGHLDHRDRDAGVGEAHGDAAPHGAGADHRHLADLAGRRVGRDVGDLGRLALGEEKVALGLGLRRDQQLLEQLALPGQALVEGQVDGGLDGLDAGLRGPEAPRLPGDRLPELAEDLGLAAGGGDLLVEVAGLAQRSSLGHHPVGERHRPRDQVALHQLVEEAQAVRLRASDGVAAHDHLERVLHSHQARQALGAAGPREEAELHLRLAQARRADAHAPVTGHGHLEAPAERGAVDGGHHRLPAPLDQLQDLVQARLPGRRAELRDVGAGDERAPGAGDEHGGRLGVGGGLAQPVAQALTHVLAERVDGRVVDGQDGQATAAVEAHGLGDGWHGGSSSGRRSAPHDTRSGPTRRGWR
jgi:signal transduction histidine kinase/CheY-like chemotaxis protein